MSDQQPPNEHPQQQPPFQPPYQQSPVPPPQYHQQPPQFQPPPQQFQQQPQQFQQQPWRQPGAGQVPPKPNPHKTRNIVVASAVGAVLLIGVIGGAFSDGGAAGKQEGNNTQPAAVSSAPPDNGPTPDPVTTPKAQPSQPKPTASAPKTTPLPKVTPKPKPKPVVYKKLTSREWAKLVKSPDDHVGETILVYGVVTQFDAATGEDGFRADTDARRHTESYEYSENTVFQQEADAGTLDDVVEGDFFTAKVKVLGSYSYDTQIGGNTTVPSFEVVSISITGHEN